MSQPWAFERPGLARVRASGRAHPQAADGLLALAVYGFALLVPVLSSEHDLQRLTLRGALVGAVVCASLTFRRRAPVAVLAVTTAGMAAYLASGGMKSPLMLTTDIALYTVALTGTRQRAVVAAVAVAAALVATGWVFGVGFWLGPEIVALAAQSAGAAAAGDAVRNRRAYIAEVEERARRAERTREEEARRRVLDERLRIARELHDVLAHHVALINVQAGVAAHVLETEPQQARESLAHIRRAARSSLEEVRTTIGLLRHPGTPDEPSAEPSPGLDRLPDLVAGFTAAGLVIDLDVTGTPVDLPSATDLTAYRIVQEALTNASRHASRPFAAVHLDYRPYALQVVVGNPAAPSPPADSGHGIIGMRERALAVGGAFGAGHRDGRFEVRASLPHPGAGA
ncbi:MULTISPECIES: sensor histidine kinase [Actinomadura]|uniref:histidine kinase n=1 Tax=Actinomadura yumaensis TaxID=111807 RepID=A0ABW2D1Y7_9ACTN|nr:histidine kinase [Actinomadura sp. J1-007]MWK38893.1 two-component sensor histidine kinase [Actinomadura sp. J1-007]